MDIRGRLNIRVRWRERQPLKKGAPCAVETDFRRELFYLKSRYRLVGTVLGMHARMILLTQLNILHVILLNAYREH